MVAKLQSGAIRIIKAESADTKGTVGINVGAASKRALGANGLTNTDSTMNSE